MNRQELLEKLEQKREEMTAPHEVENYILNQMIAKGYCTFQIYDNPLVRKFGILETRDNRLIEICKKYNLSCINPSPRACYYLIQFNPKE